jgi:23S rRNA (cytidine1920-2'-O)/16S rRNA (cytidine1409-2'-O)-methyltransferase
METTRRRLDVELVRLGHASTRGRAVALIAAGWVWVDGVVADKASLDVSGREVTLRDQHGNAPRGHVSRGAGKLLNALDELPDLTVTGRRCLDAGASTGGFTQVLLDRGAAAIVAVDVGHDQLARELRVDPRVAAHEGVSVRSLGPADIGGRAELTVADLSFISLTQVLVPLAACTTVPGDLLLLIKPQFEVGRANLGKGGVVRDVGQRVRAVVQVLEAANAAGLRAVALARSAWPGPAGNIEIFAWLQPVASDTAPSATMPDGHLLRRLVDERQPAEVLRLEESR